MPERLRCKKCGLEWTYAGYPAFIGCPKCGHLKHVPVEHEETCDKCKGAGKVLTNEVKEPLYNGVDNDRDACEAAKEIARREGRL